MLENLILSRNLNEQIQPKGRPVTNGLDFCLLRLPLRPFTRPHTAVHRGVDFAGRSGAQVVAVAARRSDAGRASASATARWSRSITAMASVTRYAHNERNLVSVGRPCKGPADRADGLYGPRDRAESALRSAPQRQPGESTAACGRALAHPSSRSRLSHPARRPGYQPSGAH